MSFKLKVKKVLAWRFFWVLCVVFVMFCWGVRVTSISLEKSTNLNPSFSSDSVIIQNIVWNWQHGYHESVTVSEDNWFLKYPFYIITNNSGIKPAERLVVTSMLLAAFTLTLVFVSLNGLIKEMGRISDRRRGIVLLLLALFLAGISKTALQIIQLPNSRNIEIGIVMVLLWQLFVAISKYSRSECLSRRRAVLLAVLLACLLVNDPLFFYDLALPVVGISLLLYVIDKKFRLIHRSIFLLTLVSLVVSYPLLYLVKRVFNLELYSRPANLASPGGLVDNTQLLLVDGLKLVGISIGDSTLSAVSTMAVIPYALVFISSCYGIYLLRNKFVGKYYLYLSLLMAASISIFLVNGMIGQGDKLISRYVIMLIPLEIIGLLSFLLYVDKRKVIYALAGILISMTAITVGRSAVQVQQNYGTDTYARYTAIENAANNKSVTRGYANYSYAGLGTYLSDYKITITSANCSQQDSSLYYFTLFNESEFMDTNSSKSFYLYDTKDPSDCSSDVLVKQFGKPSSVEKIDDHLYIAFYSYDIGSKLKGRP